MHSPRHTLEHLLQGRDLSEVEAADLLRHLTSIELAPAMAGALLAALRGKGVTAAEVRGFAGAMRALARRPKLPEAPDAIDIVGTGGDASGSLNLSTGAALLTAACGLPVVKHGNRSISSRSGSADLIEQLGFKLPLDENQAAECFAATGFTFLFAPYFHPAMKSLAPIRAALGVRTVFNLLGPLTNPAAPRFHLIGAFDAPAAELMAGTLAGMDIERAWVVHGAGGWDEATPIGPFLAFDVRGGQVERREIDPSEFGLETCEAADLAGGGAAANLAALLAVFEGVDQGPHRAALVLQSGLALFIAGRAPTIGAGIRRASTVLEEGARARVAQGLAAFRLERGGRMSGFLDDMARSSAQRVQHAASLESLADLERRARAAPAPPRLQLSPRFDVIAELKLRSPAAGVLGAASDDWLARVIAYARGGAAAVSVLTEPTRFDGSLQHLEQAAAALRPLGVPVMRKDFLVDPYQIAEARAAGAGGVLLILRMLPSAQIVALLDAASEHGLFVLLEAFDAADLEHARALLAKRRSAETVLVGINCRDLQTLTVVQQRFDQLASLLPGDRACVAESGVATPADARSMRQLGYRLALIGSALMSCDDPAMLLGEILQASRTLEL